MNLIVWRGLPFVKICCISHAIILINFEVRWGSIILTLINRLLDETQGETQGDLDHQSINPGARLIYSLVTPYILSIQLLDALLRIQSYEFMINWLLACLTPQHTSNKSAEKPLKDYSQKTFQGFSHLSDLWWKEVRKVSEMKKYLLLWIYSDWNGNNETVCKGPSYPPPTHPHPKSGTQAKCGSPMNACVWCYPTLW